MRDDKDRLMAFINAIEQIIVSEKVNVILAVQIAKLVCSIQPAKLAGDGGLLLEPLKKIYV